MDKAKEKITSLAQIDPERYSQELQRFAQK